MLARLEQARTSLAEVTAIPAAKTIRDQAEALRYAAKQAEASLEVQNLCAELKLRAERRIGELLQVTVEHGGDRRSSSSSHHTNLKDLGITGDQSSRWQRIASVPEPDFERHIEDTKSVGGELTTAGVLRLASARAQRDEETSERMWAAVGDPDGKIEAARLRLAFSTSAKHVSSMLILDPTAIAEAMDERDRELARRLIRHADAWFDRLEAAMDGRPSLVVMEGD